MKKRPFLAGMATMALIGGLTFSALAASGSFTITVDPINVQVNGATFQPKDAKGNDVPVFSYNGTTYAPLRALAEAYGLEVGYDAKTNMATVGETATPTTPPADYSDWSKEDEAAYQEFKGMWEVTNRWYSDGKGSADFTVTCKDDAYGTAFFTTHTDKQCRTFAARLFRELLPEEFDAHYTPASMTFIVGEKVIYGTFV